ncbi:phospho-N-acetylmuramoyl-pentapeptide-transferase [Candidatus Gracilibacteria bacterium]|nr:phospho-N-acetylmuramoyl-pentapeptide-transferase [Candidatus Gracilibacteria bacterium]
MSNLIFILTSLIITALLTIIIMPASIRLFTRLGLGKNIRSEGLVGKAIEFSQLHAAKRGTPTMGGVIIIGIILFVILISVIMQYFGKNLADIFGVSFKYSLWNRKETYIVIFTLVSVGIIGMIDDYLNVKEIGKTKGLSAKVKMFLLIIFAFAGAYWFSIKLEYTEISIPFYGHIDIGYFYIPLFILIVISAANSVNMTDGLDGLAGGLLLFQFLAYGAITYIQGMFILSAFCLITVGVLMGFLWYNIHPAKIFMGDTGSLALGATLAVIAMMTDTLLAFIIMSSIFIGETLSVIIQMLSKRFRNGKKVFRIAPFHHHLEAIGWDEETIVMRFWLIGMILTITGTIVALIGRI